MMAGRMVDIDVCRAGRQHDLVADTRPVRSRWLRRSLLLVASFAVALGLAELLLRSLAPAALFVQGRDTEGWTENTPTFDAFMQVDAELGYLPLRSTMLYDEHGLCRDQPVDQALPVGERKLLWLGDSVTARRFLEREVRRQAGVGFASFCGGVEGYNAEQTLGYYRRVLRRLPCDQVVFTLHHNDWWNTPIVFYDDQRRIHCRTLDRQVAAFSPFWFQHSYVYRACFSLWMQAAAEHVGAAADQKVAAALRGLRDVVAADGRRLLVLWLPPMRPLAGWSAAETARHRAALGMLRDLGIPTVDLLPGLERALAAGVDPQQLPNDWMHPSEAVAVHLAAEVLRQQPEFGR